MSSMPSINSTNRSGRLLGESLQPEFYDYRRVVLKSPLKTRCRRALTSGYYVTLWDMQDRVEKPLRDIRYAFAIKVTQILATE